MDSLDARKQLILRAVIEDYVATGEPIGSRSLARNHGLGVSPATIRNEMADLVESGYLEQPHTSAGRVPTDKGYRFYVDHFARRGEPVAHRAVPDAARLRARQIGDTIRKTARFLSEASQFLALVTGPHLERSRIETLKVVPVRADRALLVLVTDDGFVEHRLIETDGADVVEDIERVNRLLAERLSGLALGAAAQTAMKDLAGWFRSYRDFVDLALELLEEPRATQPDRLVMGGTTNILRQPEFRDVEKAEGLLASLEEETTVRHVLGQPTGEGSARVSIGSEISVREMQDCSIVAASYRYAGTWGQIAVLGPKRMDYVMMIDLVETVAASLSEPYGTGSAHAGGWS